MSSCLNLSISSSAPNDNTDDDCNNNDSPNNSTNDTSKRVDSCSGGGNGGWGIVIWEVVGGIGQIVIRLKVTVDKSSGTVAPEVTAA
jgi:hypothetical protein